jgi:hypothetical protein
MQFKTVILLLALALVSVANAGDDEVTKLVVGEGVTVYSNGHVFSSKSMNKTSGKNGEFDKYEYDAVHGKGWVKVDKNKEGYMTRLTSYEPLGKGSYNTATATFASDGSVSSYTKCSASPTVTSTQNCVTVTPKVCGPMQRKFKSSDFETGSGTSKMTTKLGYPIRARVVESENLLNHPEYQGQAKQNYTYINEFSRTRPENKVFGSKITQWMEKNISVDSSGDTVEGDDKYNTAEVFAIDRMKFRNDGARAENVLKLEESTAAKMVKICEEMAGLLKTKAADTSSLGVGGGGATK